MNKVLGLFNFKNTKAFSHCVKTADIGPIGHSVSLLE